MKWQWNTSDAPSSLRSLGATTLLLLGCLSAGPIEAQELPWTHFGPEHSNLPLPSASVQAVFQDHLGYIWFGFFSSGLGRYDGHILDNYDTPDGLVDSTVREIAEDGRGFLWVGSETGVVVSDDLTGEFTGDGSNPACDDPLAPLGT